VDIENLLAFLEGLDDIELQQPQFAIGYDEEVAAAAGGIKKPQARQLFMKLDELVAVLLYVLIFFVKVVEEKGLDDLEDILFGGIMGAQVSPLFGVHHALKQRAEDSRGDLTPVEAG